MEEMLCARAPKGANGPAEPPHSIWTVVLSGERALKSAGERNTHNQVGAGTFGKPPAVRGTLGVQKHIWHPAATWRRGVPPAGKLLTALLGERLRRSQLAALTPSCVYVLAGHK
jgi:hypothetical protein